MKKNPYSGKFIVFEGLDGSGQSTQAALLKDYLIEKGYEVILTKEPTNDSEAGKKIRKILDKKSETDPQKLQKLFAKDRKEHLKKVIIPALREEKIVISDRYFFSSFAFGAASGVDLDYLVQINNEFLLPDLTFFLKVPPRVCLERLTKRGGQRTLFEELEKMEKVWQVFETLPKRFKNVYIVEGEGSVEGVFSQVKALLGSKLNL